MAEIVVDTINEAIEYSRIHQRNVLCLPVGMVSNGDDEVVRVKDLVSPNWFLVTPEGLPLAVGTFYVKCPV